LNVTNINKIERFVREFMINKLVKNKFFKLVDRS
jgi:hypothetical protein